MAPFDRHSHEIGSFGKLPQLWEEDDSRKKSKATHQLSFSTQYHEPLKDFHNLDSLFLDISPPFQHQMQELANIESQYSELIKPQKTHITTERTSNEVVYCERKLSTDAVIRLGGERFIQSCSSSINDISFSNHPYATSFSGFSDQESKDIQLIESLLHSAEKVTQQQFDRSSNFLDWCDALSSNSGSPVQRLGYYFSKALREKIAHETGRISSHGSGKKYINDIKWKMMTPNRTNISIYQKLPFFQAAHFPGVQALVDAITGSTKVHIIDLSIKQGIQCTILMQALTSQPNCTIKYLKITAVETNFKENIEHTGDLLKSFAESLNLSFSFNVAMVGDMLDFKEDLLELDSEEALAVYSSYGLWEMIGQHDRLESLMNVLKNMNPRVMVVSEAAVNLNSPNFVNRFIEALFFYCAFFDCLEDCMDSDDENRGITESVYLGNGISSIVGTEGAERVVRHVNIDVWRKFFTRFGMKETELSMSSLYQANLMGEKLPCGGSCTFDMDGNCLIIGWKGTPIQCLSVWKFS